MELYYIEDVETLSVCYVVQLSRGADFVFDVYAEDRYSWLHSTHNYPDCHKIIKRHYMMRANHAKLPFRPCGWNKNTEAHNNSLFAVCEHLFYHVVYYTVITFPTRRPCSWNSTSQHSNKLLPLIHFLPHPNQTYARGWTNCLFSPLAHGIALRSENWASKLQIRLQKTRSIGPTIHH